MAVASGRNGTISHIKKILNENMEEKIEVLKQHLSIKEHPIRRVIDKFEKRFFEEHIPLLQKDNMEQKSKLMIRKNTEKAIREVQFFVGVIFRTLLKFYKIIILATNTNKELVINMLTNIILKDKVYEIVFLLICKDEEDNVRELTNKMQKLEAITLQHLNLPEYFHLDPEFRKRIVIEKANNPEIIKMLTTDNASKANHNALPYAEAIKQLKSIIDAESPIDKLDKIYEINDYILKELEVFWKGVDVKKNKLQIDADTLLGIITYIVLKSQYPKLLCEHRICEEFLTTFFRLSNKGYHLTNLRVSIEYILGELEKSLPNKWKSEEMPSQKGKHTKTVSSIGSNTAKLIQDFLEAPMRTSLTGKEAKSKKRLLTVNADLTMKKYNLEFNMKSSRENWTVIDEEMVWTRYQENRETEETKRTESLSAMMLPNIFLDPPIDPKTHDGHFGSFMGIEADDQVIEENMISPDLCASPREEKATQNQASDQYAHSL